MQPAFGTRATSVRSPRCYDRSMGTSETKAVTARLPRAMCDCALGYVRRESSFRAALALCAVTAPGCAGISRSPHDVTAADASIDITSIEEDVVSVPTYWRDIAPIINANCIACHTAGGIAPIALTSYASVQSVAMQMAQVTASAIMPPWLPSSNGCRPLQDPRVLTDAQLNAIAQWAAHGAPEGNAADYVAAQHIGPQPLLPPVGDIIARPNAVYLPDQAVTDDYRCFPMDLGLTTTTDIVGLRVTPGDARIVHHVILFEVREPSLPDLHAMDDADPGPGYACFGGTGIAALPVSPPAGTNDIVNASVQLLGGWLPGTVAGYFPAGTGIRLQRGSRLVMQVHYNLSDATRGIVDQTRVDLYTSSTPVGSQALWLPIANAGFSVPPGAGPTDPGGTAVMNTQLQYNFRIFGLQPHMHTHGREIRIDLLHADGTSDCLLDIPSWEFHWQQAYWFVDPVPGNPSSPNGAMVRLTCTWDNTAANQPVIDGVRAPPHELHWGEGTSDEMCINFLYVAR